MFRSWCLVVAVATMLATQGVALGELQELAWYRLGEEDDVSAGDSVELAIESLEGRDMQTLGDLVYSDDTPAGIDSTLSVAFDGDDENYLFADAVAWQNLYPGFRVGMEAWVKVSSDSEGISTVPFGAGTGYYMSIDEEGYPIAHAFSTTPQGPDVLAYDEWQHVAFWTTGSFWQVYVNGEAQHETLPNFNYGSPSGQATIGADREGLSGFSGLIDEYRIFTWTGAFDPADLLFFTQRNPGDVNEDGAVDQIDYDIWRMNVDADLEGVTLIDGRGMGDLNGDRVINLDDFALIKENFTAPANAAVPEPGSALLMVIGLTALAAFRRRATC